MVHLEWVWELLSVKADRRSLSADLTKVGGVGFPVVMVGMAVGSMSTGVEVNDW